MSKYLQFNLVESPSTRKTSIWSVDSKSQGNCLGLVKWFGAWRQYSFFPESKTIFNIECLRDIQNFITARMEDRLEGRA